MEQELPGELHDWRQKLSEVREMTEHTIVEIRRLIAALSPAILEEMGLAPALRQLITRFRRLYPAEVRLQVPRRLDIPKKVEIIIYRLVQEILNNVAKYSMADRVNLSVETADGYLRMNVEDNGVGFDVTEAFSRRDCFGLSGLKERVALLGGSLEVKSLLKATESGSGTENGGPQRVKGNKAGQIGVDRHGTAIWIDLPVPPRGQSGLVRTKPRTGRETAKRRWAEGKTLGS